MITGALGHIGSRLIRALPEWFPSTELVLVDDLSSQRFASLFDLPKPGRYRFVEGDISALDLAPVVRGSDAVIHLAAITDAPSSFQDPPRVERVNLHGTRRVAEACLSQGVPLVFPSTTSVYGPQGSFVDEDCPPSDLAPQSPYAASKLAAEGVVRELVGSGLRAITFRFGTIFGPSPGMRFHTAVNKFCWQAALGQPITVWRTAYEQKRPYLDLEDAVRAVAHVLRNDLFDGGLYNVVTVNATVRQVVEAIREQVPTLQVSFVDHAIMNQLSYEVSGAKFRARGFSYEGDLPRAIARTFERLSIRNGNP